VTTVSPSRDAPPHVLLTFGREMHRQARVVSWVRQGLARGEKIIYSTVPGDTVVPALRTGGREAAVALQHGQFSLVPATDFFPGARQAELVREALDEGYPAVRLAARADEALRQESLGEYQAVDRLMHELCSSLPVSALCQLDTGGVSPQTVTTLIDGHAGVVEDAQMRIFSRAGQIVVSGEVDFSSAAVVTSALRCLSTLDGPSTIIVDLSDLSFVDVAGCRALVAGTDDVRRAGASVTFHGVVGHVRRLMTLLEMDRLPAIEVQ
jgi:anti-anti-sigma factor